MLKSRPKEWIKERRDPGEREPEYCSPGSIEQELDMCEVGSLRGDQILHDHGRYEQDWSELSREGVDHLMGFYQVDMSEDDREGTEMSGDEHSFGMQGGEPELDWQPHLDSGMPGDRDRHRAHLEGVSIHTIGEIELMKRGKSPT